MFVTRGGGGRWGVNTQKNIENEWSNRVPPVETAINRCFFVTVVVYLQLLSAICNSAELFTGENVENEALWRPIAHFIG